MKTEMRAFCNDYTEKLEPFSSTLKTALESIPEPGADSMLDQWRLRLQEVFHRAETLNDKIAQQHAFLLIFGPLKSGKSTLMNAISGAYVSEVSSLPAYPALVYVRDGKERAFRATTYSGDKIEFENSQAMSEKVSQGHEELARRILEVERDGESFDPQKHFPEAIRRMDVETPAEALAESGSVLVDTPGLYTRMRFGYDVMTRDFRDTASCAIFVVKSDNLFFEKVFEEFNELLGHFSRIFLVVNIDSSKRDLSANGSLEPSLESREPEAIVQAFQSLAMSAPLREAYEKGNLNVYPIDLLESASRQLKQQAGDDLGGEDVPPENEGFRRFLNDLTEYLNSSDYLREFIYDSLRVGDNLQDEVADVASGEAAGKLKNEAEQWRKRLDEADGKLKALNELDNIDWQAAFKDVRLEKDRLLEEYANKDRSALAQALNDALEQWLDSDDTLKTLRDQYLNRHIEKETADDAKSILERLRSMMNTKDGGARLATKESQALERAGLRIDEIAPGLLQALSTEETPRAPKLELEPEDVPIKRSFSDSVMLRNNKAIRERFFGAEGTAPIPSSIKRKRISGKQLEALREKITGYPQTDLPQIQQDYINRVLDAYIEKLSQSLKEKRDSLKSEWAKKRAEYEAQLNSNREVQKLFERLAAANTEFGQAVDSLREQYGSVLDSGAQDASEISDEDIETLEYPDETLVLDDADIEDSR